MCIFLTSSSRDRGQHIFMAMRTLHLVTFCVGNGHFWSGFNPWDQHPQNIWEKRGYILWSILACLKTDWEWMIKIGVLALLPEAALINRVHFLSGIDLIWKELKAKENRDSKASSIKNMWHAVISNIINATMTNSNLDLEDAWGKLIRSVFVLT